MVGSNSKYGIENTPSNSWSIPFEYNIFNEILFTTTDQNIWLRVSKDQLKGFYDG